MTSKAQFAAEPHAIDESHAIELPLGRSNVRASNSELKERNSETRRLFDGLVRELRPDLYRYAFWLSRDEPLAEDVVQEALLRAWRAFGSLKERESAKQWLLTIVRREHARAYERKRPPTTEIDALTGTELQPVAAAQDPDVECVRRAILRLGDEYREPLVLQVLMGYKTEEIAKIMELAQGAVLTRLFRARRKLKAQLGIEGGE